MDRTIPLETLNEWREHSVTESERAQAEPESFPWKPKSDYKLIHSPLLKGGYLFTV